jgi:hypothetical protein
MWALTYALEKAEGDKLLAAKMLGIGKSTLYRKLNEHSIRDDIQKLRPKRREIREAPAPNPEAPTSEDAA